MATKPGSTPTKAIERLHAAYLEAKIDPELGTARVLRALAKRFGIPFADADRAATLGRWELEREARRSEAWQREYGGGARTEDEYVRFCVEQHYSHLTADGPEGARLAAAHGRDTWRRAMGLALQWRADVELRAAKEDYDAIEAVRREMAAKRSTRRAA